MKELSSQVKALDEDLKSVEQETNDFLLTIPNMPHDSVPVGRTEDDNEISPDLG